MVGFAINWSAQPTFLSGGGRRSRCNGYVEGNRDSSDPNSFLMEISCAENFASRLPSTTLARCRGARCERLHMPQRNFERPRQIVSPKTCKCFMKVVFQNYSTEEAT